MFAAINVRALGNQSISPAINVRFLGSNCKKCSCAINVRVFYQTAKSANIKSARTFVDLQYLNHIYYVHCTHSVHHYVHTNVKI